MTGSGVDALQAARAGMDTVIEEIPAVDGFTQFLAPPTFDDVAGIATTPLVYLAAAEFGGLALVVRADDVARVPLDALTADAVRGRVETHLSAYTAYRADPTSAGVGWSEALSTVTRWLWEDAVGPVLDELGAATEAVFVAGGLLGLLPLHAAWTPDGSTPTGRRYALDRMTISYAPNARALRAARELAAQVPGRRVLSIVEPGPVPAPPLPFARIEAAGLAVAAGLDGTALAGPDATPLRFLHHARDADILHLACHGWADLEEPLNSGLLLAGSRVTLRELLELEPPLRIRLAVLSACETALPGTELSDEVIGLPTGLLQAGVAGVVGSQWAVLDRATAMLMTEFTRLWAGGDRSPAAALREAQCWLRDTTNAEKRTHWLAAMGADRHLPREVVEEFVAMTGFGDPDARDHQDLAAWAAFAHIGA